MLNVVCADVRDISQIKDTWLIAREPTRIFGDLDPKY